MQKSCLAIMVVVSLLLAGCSSSSSNNIDMHAQEKPLTTAAIWKGDHKTIWDRLQHSSTAKLAMLSQQETNATQRAWLELAFISKQKHIPNQKLVRDLIAWRTHHPKHPATQLIPDLPTLQQIGNSQAPQQIAVLLPQSGLYASSGKAVREGFLNAYYKDLNASTNQSIKFYDTHEADIKQKYAEAIADGADFVVGPLLKEHVQTLAQRPAFKVPTLSLNYTAKKRLFTSAPKNFYEFGLLPEDEVIQIAYKAHSEGHLHALVIAADNTWGKRLYGAFKPQWLKLGGKITETLFLPIHANYTEEIAKLLRVSMNEDKKLMHENNQRSVLEHQRRQDFDVIFLFSQPGQGRRVVPLLRYYYASGVPMYATSAIYSEKLNRAKNIDLDGVIVCDIPWKQQRAVTAKTNPSAQRLYAVGQDAYMLTQTLQRLVKLPNLPVYGKTGALMLADQKIHRRIPCSQIKNGRL